MKFLQSKKEIKKTSSQSSYKQKGFWKKFAEKHWYAPDLPNGEPIFQPSVFAKWTSIYVGLPVAGFFFAILLVSASETKKGVSLISRSSDIKVDSSKSQILDFNSAYSASSQYLGYVKRAPGTLVRVKLLNSVEGYSNAPVHAQIVDSALGKNLFGGTLLGEAYGDQNLDRVTITFNFVRDPLRANVAIPIKARALANDGTLGISANKKEGILARSTLGAGSRITQDAQSAANSFDIRQILLKAITTGFLEEASNGINTEKNKASLLFLNPETEFFAELTGFFPEGQK